MSFISVAKLSRLEKKSDNRPDILVSIYAFFTFCVLGLHIINEIFWRNYNSLIIELILLIINIGIYAINEKGYHRLAKRSLLVFLNLIVFGFSNVVPHDLGTYYFFFPIITIPAIIFNRKERVLQYVFMIVPIVLILLLKISNFQFFGSININEGIVDRSSETINLFASMLILCLSLVYMFKSNDDVEDMRNSIAEKLDRKNKKLKKANKELVHFSYRASHDLKAPLSTILGLINIAKYDISHKPSLKYFNEIEQSIRKLIRLLGDIMNLSKNAHLSIEKEVIDLDELTNRIIDNFRNDIYVLNGIELRKEINVRKIVSDQRRIEVVLNSLLANAIKFQRADEKNKRIFISTEIFDSKLLLAVEDNGQGISESIKDKVFDMFYRGNSDSDGSGLGLYIVADIVGKMKGKVNISSKENEGTRVEALIPID